RAARGLSSSFLQDARRATLRETFPARNPQAARRPHDAARGSWESSPPAAFATAAAPAVAGHENIVPASWARQSGYCARPPAPEIARAARWNVRAPDLPDHAVATAPRR